ncbi:UNVERIFIED_CONTAM: F-box/kelch-repeat protein OR23 [Sesamum radiatum]|uniref:F-box/kelch-repeat protein OR23 n=1 Tax=Sesamum radiatum TaxID=300843 RepID=A0AAW2UPD7_SESRA
MAPPSSFEDFGIQTLTLTLIPGLPNDLGALILAFVPYSHHSRLKSTCRSWRRFFSSKALISLRQNYVVAPQLLCIFPQDPSISSPYLFDPKNLSWCPLPPMPCNPHVYGLSNFISVSVGPHLYVLGGSLFDTRSFPLDRPSPSSSAFRFDFATFSWESLSPMITPRGSFACAAVPGCGKIVVAGGGSRHTMFGAAGSRMSSVEMYDIVKDEWVALDGLPRFRAGCVGFFLGREFWVMGGYGESRTVSGVFPVDEYYKDAVVMELKNGGRWRELGDMWEEGERRRLGKIVVVDNGSWDCPGIFMLDRGEIFRYDMTSNRWVKELCAQKSL